MRYQSAPVVTEEKKETSSERRARHHQERKKELTYTKQDYERYAKNREERIQKEIVKLKKEKAEINFFPRENNNGMPKLSNKLGTLGKAPSLKDKSKVDGHILKQAIDGTACLVHGIDVQFLKSALTSMRLFSAYLRCGPNGHYNRDADKNGGGATAVYTRAVGKVHTKYPAKGYGVGGSGKKAVLILKPHILLGSDNWRCSSTDNKGALPGATSALIQRKIRDVNIGYDIFNAWEEQSKKSRDLILKDIVSKKTYLEQNEQCHWSHIDLSNNLAAILVPESNKEIMNALGCKDNMYNLGGERIPIIQYEPKDLLKPLLERNHVELFKRKVS